MEFPSNHRICNCSLRQCNFKTRLELGQLQQFANSQTGISMQIVSTYPYLILQIMYDEVATVQTSCLRVLKIV